MSTGPTLEQLLDLSVHLETALRTALPTAGLVPETFEKRYHLATVSAVLAIEHAHAIRASFHIGAPNSALALLRIQSEALIRAAWLAYAASPQEVDALDQSLSHEAERAANKLPSYTAMLKELEKSAPHGLVKTLSDFYQNTRHPLNSFVHAGLHPLSRMRRAGIPESLMVTALQYSNALLHMSYRLVTGLGGHPQVKMDEVTRLWKSFVDCFPITKDTV